MVDVERILCNVEVRVNSENSRFGGYPAVITSVLKVGKVDPTNVA
jgi:hypothetical protein